MTEPSCCRYWREHGARTCVGCDAANAARRGDIWRTRHARYETVIA